MVTKCIIKKIAIFVLAILFIYGAALHVFNPTEMLRGIENFEMISGRLAILGAYLIPWMELWAGIGLLFKRSRAASALLIFGLVAIFAVSTAFAWKRGINLNCGCFGYHPGEAPDDYRLLMLRHLGFLILSGYIFFTSLQKKRC